ncbi:Transposase and inactivated derivatives%2C IS30 family [uncultured Clostridium sp.]|nr:Transposase and inactivated derivatives%2C IS30 family [uncultured Clostridium sp.]
MCEIARLIGKHHSTVSREIRRGQYVHRNSDWIEEVRYSSELAEEKYQAQLRAKGANIKLGNDYELARYLEKKIREEKYSPAAALSVIKREEKD